jgi:hypothetical protein
MHKLILAGIIVLTACVSVRAVPVTYTETVVGSGTFDGAAYTNQLITLVGTADTSNVTNPVPGVPNIFSNNDSLATVTVGGVGTDTFTDSISTSVNQGNDRAGFVDATTNFAVLFTTNSAFGAYEARPAANAVRSAEPSVHRLSLSVGSVSVGIFKGSAVCDGQPRGSVIVRRSQLRDRCGVRRARHRARLGGLGCGLTEKGGAFESSCPTGALSFRVIFCITRADATCRRHLWHLLKHFS